MQTFCIFFLSRAYEVISSGGGGVARVVTMSPSVISETLMAEPATEMMMKKPGHSQAQDFIYRSKLPDIDMPNHMPLADYCLEKAAQWADKACLIDGTTGRVHTYGEIALSSRRVAAGLAKLGMKQGGVLALLLPNCAEFVQVFLGAAKLGAIVTTANPFYTAAEVEKQIIASGATLVVTQASYIEKLAGINVQVPNDKFYTN
jgi:4-coumarate--CoA ligase